MSGLSMAALAAKMDGIVSPQAVYKYEAGKMLPDSTVLNALCDVLGVDLDYFFKPVSVALEGISFRKKSKMTEKEKKMIIGKIKDGIERYYEIEDICGISRNFTMNFHDVTVSEGKDVYELADRLRTEWNLGKSGINNVIGGIWDFIDDFVVSFAVEKTRTRWGKFVPYLFLSSLPYAIIVGIYWLLPIIFKANIDNFDYIPKFIAYVVFEMLIEMVTNFRTVATSGYLSTITPFPSDRRRLLAVTKYLNLFYAGLPNTLVEFMLDFITNGLIKAKNGKTEADMIRTALVRRP